MCLLLQHSVLAVQRGYSPALVQQVSDLSTINYVLVGIKLLAKNVTGIIVPNSGHWIPEEHPEFVINQLSSFFGNSTNGTE
jgi:pimeloyl-ACP methyl ester carboxylesterase